MIGAMSNIKYYRFNGNNWEDIYNLKISRIYNNDKFTHEAKYQQYVDDSLWKLISYLNLNEYRIKDVFRKTKPIVETFVEVKPKIIHNTKRVSWKDDTDHKYYLSEDLSTIFKINKYKIYINKFDKIAIEFVYYQTRHHWTNRKLAFPCWVGLWEQIDSFDSIEDFIHNRIFDSFYQANKVRLELDPKTTKEQLEQNQVKLNWMNKVKSQLYTQVGWDENKPINLL